MPNRQAHQQEIRSFLQAQLSIHNPTLSLPRGSGMETYFAQANGQAYFVKLGVLVERYLVMADVGLAPPVLAFGQLENGLSVIVQPLIDGRTPSRKDYRDHLESVAKIIYKFHNDPTIHKILPLASSHRYKEIGLQALNRLQQKWQHYKAQVPKVAEFIEQSLEYLATQIRLFSGNGLVSSHNDICNANWLFASDDKIYLVDFDSISLEDPALDLGALLWWYYPPELRQRFLEIAGYRYDDDLKFRMQVRMSMHCLNITLPRAQSFDHFDAKRYHESLDDFRASLAGRQNPQGYG